MNIGKLAEGLKILIDHGTGDEPLNATHDELFIGGPSPAALSEDDFSRLKRLGFRWDQDETCWAVFT